MSADLVAYLRERIAEEEADALAASPGPWTFLSGKSEVGTWIRAANGEAVTPPDVNTDGDWEIDPDNGPHIARWDPARALAEVAAKRAILDAWERMDATAGEWIATGIHDEMSGMARGAAEGMLLAVDLVAQPYSGRDDFLPEWK